MLHPFLSRISLALIMLFVNHCSLYCMEEKSLHLFDDRLEQEFQKKLVKKVIKRVDDMSYIGQANKQCYAEVKRQQIAYIATMHRLQDPSLIRVNIPPFVFRCDRKYHNGKGAIDPNSREFYKQSTIDSWPLSNAVATVNRLPESVGYNNDTFHVVFADADKYERRRPTNLLIACLQQNEGEAQRLVRMYPLAKEHIIPDSPQSEHLYRDPLTPMLFREALSVSKMIPGNKATQVLLDHLATIGFTEETWIESQCLEKERKSQMREQERLMECFLGNLLLADLPVMELFTPEEEERARKGFEEMILSAAPAAPSDILKIIKHTPEEEQARKDFEEMILSVTRKPNEFHTFEDEGETTTMQYVTISSESYSSEDEEDDSAEGPYLLGLMKSMGTKKID
jgi:hypothetical protein